MFTNATLFDNFLESFADVTPGDGLVLFASAFSAEVFSGDVNLLDVDSFVNIIGGGG